MPKVKQDDNGQPAKPTMQKPKLTNRGGAGLYAKIKGRLIFKKGKETLQATSTKAKHRIAIDLQQYAVPIDILVLDSMNARLHPERNIEAIKASLTQYGQQHLLVARRDTHVVIVGNGRLEAARSLGWKEIAVRFVDMNDVEATGFGLADNTTAELARWDFEVKKRLVSLLEDADHQIIGLPQKELDMLRAIDWVPPEESEDQSAGLGSKYQIVVTCDDEQQQLVLLEQLTQEGHTCRALVS